MFLDKIKNINLYDLFALDIAKGIIDQEVKSNGFEMLSQITEEVIEEIKSTPNEIPFRRDILKYIFKCSDTDIQFLNNMLNQIDKYRLKGNNPVLRSVAIEILSEYRPYKMLQILIDIARDQTEDDTIKFNVLEYLKKIVPKETDYILLLEILKENNEQLSLAVMDVLEHHKEQSPFRETQNALDHIFRFSTNLILHRRAVEFSLAVMDVLEHHQEQASFKETQNALEYIFRYSTNLTLRCRAVELLGIFGEIDIIERICMLPLNEPEMQASVQKMVQHIISKPRNILYLRPENFEHLIKEWLVKIGHEQVQVTRHVKDDGVDVIAYKEGDGIIDDKRYIVVAQCKRYTTDKIQITVLEDLIKAYKNEGANKGLLITTSSFSKDTKKLAESNRFIKLIDREELQNQLDKAFGKNCYCIINRN